MASLASHSFDRSLGTGDIDVDQRTAHEDVPDVHGQVLRRSIRRLFKRQVTARVYDEHVRNEVKRANTGTRYQFGAARGPANAHQCVGCDLGCRKHLPRGTQSGTGYIFDIFIDFKLVCDASHHSRTMSLLRKILDN